MKIHKKVGILIAGVALSAAIVGMSACSIIVPLLDSGEGGGGGGSSDSGSGSDSVAGTYNFELSLYDTYFLENTAGMSSFINYVAGEPVQYNTLVLNSDGTYELTKELEIVPDESISWGAYWDAYYSYTYYGTYTNSGSSVTLGQVQSVAYEVSNPQILATFGGTVTVVDYTETTDLESSAALMMSTTTVIDLWYGAYLRDTGKGNVSQTVTLGEYEWGDYTFDDDGLSSSPDSSSEETGDETEEESLYTFIGTTNQDFTLSLYADGTYNFNAVISTYNITFEEEGTWSYDSESKILTLTYDEDNSITVSLDGTSTEFTYSMYSSSSTVEQAFSISAEDIIAAIEAAQS